MKIQIIKGINRRMAWTDRKNGYLELSSNLTDDSVCGYYRGEKKFLTDFFISMKHDEADLFRANALYTDVMPEGFTAVFERKIGTRRNALSLEVSLLLDEQAFYIHVGASEAFPENAGAGILFSRLRSDCGASGWIEYQLDGITCWQNDAGAAIASVSPFRLEDNGAGSVCLFPAESTDPTNASDSHSWYLVFEDDGTAAREKVIHLARTEAIAAHRQRIADFFGGCSLETGDSRFDDAVRWAQFSGWMLVTDDRGKGIWGGLPWFRENWGRDTFIALPGILLVSGRFAEAREVLVGFARRQNKNPSSPEYGRIPNRYRSDEDVIYNNADGTLWFIRSLWEYAQYSGDIHILDELRETVDLALEADLARRTDSHGFLLHGDADTWMDARIRHGSPWADRGTRANDIQSLWYTALRIGAEIARIQDEGALAEKRSMHAERVRESFRRFFWCPERRALADHLPAGVSGEWLRDFRVRPNQLFAVSVPSILDTDHRNGAGDMHLLSPEQRSCILENVGRELVSPFGLFSLCPDDPLFHPDHEYSEMYHKDAAYHNGTIWPWITGQYISSVALSSDCARLSAQSSALLRNEAVMILDHGCAGSISENIHAAPDKDGNPVFSGTWSQAWSVSEFARNAYQDVTGFKPFLIENRLELHPHLPVGLARWKAEVPFGPGWKLRIELAVSGVSRELRGTVLWKTGTFARNGVLPHLLINDHPLEAGIPLELRFDELEAPSGADRKSAGAWTSLSSSNLSLNGEKESLSLGFQTSVFPERDFAVDWCGAIHQKDYLEKLILGGCMKSPSGGANTAALEWFFNSDYFKRKYHTKLPLGAIYSHDQTVFRLWAPTARSVALVLYPDGSDSPPSVVLPMQKGMRESLNAGVWELAMNGDLSGVYYRFRVCVHGIMRDSADPYARSCGVNGLRSMVVDFDRTNPAGWKQIAAPALASPNDAIIYEAHVADLTSSLSWNGDSRIARTYSGAAQRGTAFRGKATGFDHIKSLGVTHVQLLPVFDFSSVDESRLHDLSYIEKITGGTFNWGYDPGNFSAPEGSYSTDPRDGRVRVRELKTLIKEFNACGIGVVMDVVYNHIPSAQNHPFGICVPGYYFRVDSFSGAGDDTASEREMFRSYMVDSLSWWLSEYRLSGFRFDLMGLHDVETMNSVSFALRNIKSDVLLYGEGWDMYRGGKMVSANMFAARKLSGIGFFNDAFRCAVKGSDFKPAECGFLHDGSHRESLKFGLAGAVYHQQVHNRYVDGTANPNPWTEFTSTSVNYTEIHDNATLYDKLLLVEPGRPEYWYERLQKTAISLILLAQGMPVLHAGMEFMRTKEIPASVLASHPNLGDLYRSSDGSRAFSHNSYNLSDKINALDWIRCADKQPLVDYVRRIIAIRRSHPLFRLRNAVEVVLSLTFLENEVPQQSGYPPVLAWVIDGCATVDTWMSVCLAVNPAPVCSSFTLPACFNGGSWHLVTDGESFPDESAIPPESGTRISIEAKALYLYAEF